MCNTNALTFALKSIDPNDVKGKKILEVGAQNVNGGVRQVIEGWHPASYTGVDITPGQGVDIVANCENLTDLFPANNFDVVVSTEVLEHVRDWRAVIRGIKTVCKPGGLIVITTRSKGFPYHAFPYDYWRYEVDDIRVMFSDCEILTLNADEQEPGVLMQIRKPINFKPADLENIELYSIVAGRRVKDISPRDYRNIRYKFRIVLNWLRSTVLSSGRYVARRL